VDFRVTVYGSPCGLGIRGPLVKNPKTIRSVDVRVSRPRNNDVGYGLLKTVRSRSNYSSGLYGGKRKLKKRHIGKKMTRQLDGYKKNKYNLVLFGLMTEKYNKNLPFTRIYGIHLLTFVSYVPT